MPRSLFLACVLALCCTGAADAQAVTWTIDPGHSSGQFTVRHMLVANVRGEFDGPTGTITFDPADFKTLKVDVSFDTKSVNTRNADRDKDLRSDLFFDVAKYPKMTFKSKRSEPSGPGRLKLIGDLTIKGVTKEVTLEVEGPTPEIKDIWGERRIGATATTTIDRRQFGLMYNRMLEGGGAVVGDTVNVTIDVEMTRKGGQLGDRGSCVRSQKSMRLKQTVVAGILLGASVAFYQVGALASGSSMPAPAPSGGGGSMPMRSPEEMAIASYNSGVDHKDKGLKIEASSGVAKDAKERAKVEDKAKKEYEKALKDFKSAASNAPQMYQAYNGMGFSYRKTGDYAKALEMYDRALQLKPGFPDAIEYRGEAYLGLNRVEDAKQAYLEILAADRKQADTLMAAMQKWIEQKKANPEGVDPAVVTGLETWLKERGDIAKQTMAMGMSRGPRW